MTRDDLFNINAGIVKTLVESIAEHAPNVRQCAACCFAVLKSEAALSIVIHQCLLTRDTAAGLPSSNTELPKLERFIKASTSCYAISMQSDHDNSVLVVHTNGRTCCPSKKFCKQINLCYLNINQYLNCG